MSADPRGPLKKITKVEREDGKVFLTRECGHRTEYASHFSYTIGSWTHCFQCGPKARH